MVKRFYCIACAALFGSLCGGLSFLLQVAVAGAQGISLWHVLAAVQMMALPFAILGSMLLTVLRRRRPTHADVLAGFLLGLMLHVLPQLIVEAVPDRWEIRLGVPLLLLAVVGLAFLGSGRGHEQRGTRLPLLSRLLPLASLGLLSMVVLPLLAGPRAGIGILPAESSAAVSDEQTQDLRPDHLGSYGYTRPTSPVLDKLAAESLRFAHAESVASHTEPAHASMFTGMLPSVHGLSSSLASFPPDAPTLAERLREHGWSTAGVVSNFVLRRQTGFFRGFQYYDDTLTMPSSFGRAATVVVNTSGVARVLGRLRLGSIPALGRGFNQYTRPFNPHASATNARADIALDRLASASAPFFLFLNYMDAHAPYQAPREWETRFGIEAEGAEARPLARQEFQHVLARLQEGLHTDNPDREGVAAMVDRYDTEISYLDHQLGKLFARLEAISAARGRPMLLIVTADHGEGFGEHGLLEHGNSLYEECLHVPLIIHGEGVAPGVVEEMVSLRDIPATLLAASGLEPIGGARDLLAGTSREAGHVVAESGRTRTISVFDRIDEVAFFFDGNKATYRVDEKAAGLEALRFHDLKEDPEERLVMGEKHQQALEVRLEGVLQAWWKTYARNREREQMASISSLEKIVLASLGYAEDED